MEVMSAYNLTDGRISISEQDTIPPPYMEAYRMVSQHLPRAQRWRAKLESK